MYVCALYECRYPERPKEVITSPGSGFCRQLCTIDVDARNQTWVLCNSRN